MKDLSKPCTDLSLRYYPELHILFLLCGLKLSHILATALDLVCGFLLFL